MDKQKKITYIYLNKKNNDDKRNTEREKKKKKKKLDQVMSFFRLLFDVHYLYIQQHVSNIQNQLQTTRDETLIASNEKADNETRLLLLAMNTETEKRELKKASIVAATWLQCAIRLD